MAVPSQYGDATITPGFVARKSKIMSDLSVPDAEYTDLSPKGSVDKGIRDLIRDINSLDGLVTTSSCAGRASIFVEGSKKTGKKRKTEGKPQAIEQATGRGPSELDDGIINGQNQSENKDEDGLTNKEGDAGRKFAPSGGKGEGRWLYVSHDPVENNIKSSYHELFGLVPGNGVPQNSFSGDGNMRLIRFHYDPMVRARDIQWHLRCRGYKANSF